MKLNRELKLEGQHLCASTLLGKPHSARFKLIKEKADYQIWLDVTVLSNLKETKEKKRIDIEWHDVCIIFSNNVI